MSSAAVTGPLYAHILAARKDRHSIRHEKTGDEVKRQEKAIEAGIQLCIDKCVLYLIETGYLSAKSSLNITEWNRMRCYDVILKMTTSEVTIEMGIDTMVVTVKLAKPV